MLTYSSVIIFLMFLFCEALTTGNFEGDIDFLGLFLNEYNLLALICNK